MQDETATSFCTTLCLYRGMWFIDCDGDIALWDGIVEESKTRKLYFYIFPKNKTIKFKFN